MDFFNQISFGPNIFLTKTTSMSTTTIKMGFDTIEINLVVIPPVASKFIRIEASEIWGPEIGGLQYFDIVP